MRAILTFTFKSSDYLPKWESYYSNYFDHLEIVTLEPEYLTNYTYVVDQQNEIHKKLLEKHELVGICDVDEFLLPNPSIYKDLDDYIQRKKDKFIRATGYNVVQRLQEPSLDLTKSILRQRSMWNRDIQYDKTVIIRESTTYFNPHRSAYTGEPDKDLLLLHLRDADIDLTIKRFAKRGEKLKLDDYDLRLRNSVLIPDKWKDAKI